MVVMNLMELHKHWWNFRAEIQWLYKKRLPESLKKSVDWVVSNYLLTLWSLCSSIRKVGGSMTALSWLNLLITFVKIARLGTGLHAQRLILASINLCGRLILRADLWTIGGTNSISDVNHHGRYSWLARWHLPDGVQLCSGYRCSQISFAAKSSWSVECFHNWLL